jgi:hypothetical protein
MNNNSNNNSTPDTGNKATADQAGDRDNLVRPKLIGGGINLNHEHTGRDSKKVKMQNLNWLKVEDVDLNIGIPGFNPPGGTEGEMRLYWNTTAGPDYALGPWLFVNARGGWWGVSVGEPFV